MAPRTTQNSPEQDTNRCNSAVTAKNSAISIIQIVLSLSPWLTGVPTAYVIAASASGYSAWPLHPAIGVVLGVAIELLGVSSAELVTLLWSYNRAKLKSSPASPTWLSVILFGVYVSVSIVITVLIETLRLEHVAPALLPLLSVAAFGNLALRRDHEHRLQLVARAKHERNQARNQAKQSAQHGATNVDDIVSKSATALTKRETIERLVAEFPQLSNSDVADRVGVSRQYVNKIRGGTNGKVS